jgi:4-amino-4-deoxy-L-arabinose transferase-like glycosyltransferase
MGPNGGNTGERSLATRGLEGLLTTRGVVSFWLLSAVAFVAMLWAVAPGRTLQDALSAEMLQGHLASGYQLRNPPLYEWLLWGVQQLAGPGPLSYLLLRYALIAAAGILFYFAGLRTTADVRVAAAFSFSLVLFFWFGWESHHSVSHSLAIIVAVLALWLTALAYADRPSLARAFGLGLVIGLGTMAKWSFLLVVASLAVALVLNRRTRGIFTDPRSLAILVGAGLPIVPFALWLAAIEPGLVSAHVATVQPTGAVTRTLAGAKDFIILLPLAFLPWILVVLAFAYRCRREAPQHTVEQAAEATRLALVTAAISDGVMVLILGAVTLGGARLFGISKFAIHYLYPFCIFAALGIAGLVAARVDPGRFARALALVSLWTALAVFVIKLANFYVIPARMPSTHLLPYGRLAEALSARGLGEAQFVTLSPRDAGNLMMYLPRARALSPSARLEPPPADPIAAERPCVFLWGGETSVPPQAPRTSPPPSNLFRRLGVTPGTGAIEDVAVDWQAPLIGKKRRSVWHVMRSGSVEDACRRFAVIGRF